MGGAVMVRYHQCLTDRANILYAAALQVSQAHEESYEKVRRPSNK